MEEPPPPPDEDPWSSERRDSKKINWSEFSGEVSNLTSNDSRRHIYDKSDAIVETSRSRKPIMPGDVYPDNYFPRVVKPTPIHSSSAQNPQYRPLQTHYMDYNSDEDMMHEALAYASEIKGLAPKSQNDSKRSDQQKQPNATAIKGGWETDSRSFSSDNSRFSSERDAGKRSASSAEESSWGATIQRQTGSHEHGYSGTLKQSDCNVVADRNSRPSNIGVRESSVCPSYEKLEVMGKKFDIIHKRFMSRHRNSF